MSAVEKNITIHQEAPAPVAVQTESASILSLIERAARDPNVDIDKMERLWAMRERARAQAAEDAFNEAMALAQSEIPAIQRKAENSHTKSRYAKLEAIAKELTPVITKHGFSMSFGIAECPYEGHYRITCKVAHKAGHTRDYQGDFPADVAGSQGKANKTAIQGYGSTLSYGRRYLTLLIFNVVLTDEDNDGNKMKDRQDEDTQFLTAEQMDTIRKALEFRGKDEAKLLQYLKVETLEQVFAESFQWVLDLINRETK